MKSPLIYNLCTGTHKRSWNLGGTQWNQRNVSPGMQVSDASETLINVCYILFASRDIFIFFCYISCDILDSTEFAT